MHTHSFLSRQGPASALLISSVIGAFSDATGSCIGQVFAMNEMKMVTSMVLRRFRLSADPKRKPLLQPTIVLRSQCVPLSYTKTRSHAF